MRNGLIARASTMVLASTMATLACADYKSGGGTGGAAAEAGGSSSSGGSESSSGGDESSSGGQQSTGGSATGGAATGGAATGGSGATTGGSSSTGGTAPSCPDVTPCGGDLVGTWTVTSSCLELSGELDLSIIGFDCTRGQIISGSLQVSGTFTASSDTTFSDETTTNGNVDFTLVDQCLSWSGTRTTCAGVGQSAFPSIGFTTGSSCQDRTGGGCTCHGPVAQSGELAVIAVNPLTSGNYTTSGSVVTLSDGFYTTSYSYCASGNTLTLTPQTTLPVTTGTIVFTRQ